jgi:gliding motility-associated peptidyl-prolyl isomerase
MQSKVFLGLSMVAVLSLFSCNQERKKVPLQDISQEQVNEKLVEANKAAIEIENRQIDQVIASKGWKMIKTATGLRYQELEKGSGAFATAGKIARFEYDVQLITGETIYSSDNTGPKEFRIGSGGVESGLEEGILLLKTGDKVRFIIPSYLAHGLSGDQDKIPPKATLIYTVKLIDLK